MGAVENVSILVYSSKLSAFQKSRGAPDPQRIRGLLVSYEMCFSAEMLCDGLDGFVPVHSDGDYTRLWGTEPDRSFAKSQIRVFPLIRHYLDQLFSPVLINLEGETLEKYRGYTDYSRLFTFDHLDDRSSRRFVCLTAQLLANRFCYVKGMAKVITVFSRTIKTVIAVILFRKFRNR